MAHKITANPKDGRVRVDPPVETRFGRESEIKTEKIGCTDPKLALRPGTMIEKGDPNFRVMRYAPDLPGLGNRTPSIADNPYNFVALASGEPWLEQPPHASHETWVGNSGIIRISAKAMAPVFVPEGFPFTPKNNEEAAEMRKEKRRFFHMRRAGGPGEHYAIPGASLKGVIRSAVEALANDRLGAFNRDFYSRPIPYRRRVYRAGLINRMTSAGYTVREVAIHYLNRNDPRWKGRLAAGIPAGFTYDLDSRQKFKKVAVPGTAYSGVPSDVRPFEANLLVAATANHDWTDVIVERGSKVVTLPQHVIDTYTRNLDHPHFEQHYKTFEDEHKKTGSRHPPKAHYPAGLLSGKSVAPFRKGLEVKSGELIFFTVDGRGDIDSFGKNVNYLWPARHSVKDLAKPFLRDPEKDPLSLSHALGMAERMFGFSAPHKDLIPTAGKCGSRRCGGRQSIRPHRPWNSNYPR